MSDERLKEIVDDIISGRAVKMTDEEIEQVSWRYESIPPNSRTIILTIKRKKQRTIYLYVLIFIRI